MRFVQVVFTANLEYTKVVVAATDLGDLGVAGMGRDPLEDCPACSDTDREALVQGRALFALSGKGAL